MYRPGCAPLSLTLTLHTFNKIHREIPFRNILFFIILKSFHSEKQFHSSTIRFYVSFSIYTANDNTVSHLKIFAWSVSVWFQIKGEDTFIFRRNFFTKGRFEVSVHTATRSIYHFICLLYFILVVHIIVIVCCIYISTLYDTYNYIIIIIHIHIYIIIIVCCIYISLLYFISVVYIIIFVCCIYIFYYTFCHIIIWYVRFTSHYCTLGNYIDTKYSIHKFSKNATWKRKEVSLRNSMLFDFNYINVSIKLHGLCIFLQFH